MYEQAVDKIRDEMAAEKDSAVRMLGEMITGTMQIMDISEKILAKEKPLSGAFAALKAEARKHAKGAGCAVVSPEDALRIALAYYGVEITEEKAMDIVMGKAQATRAQAPSARSASMDDLDLDALLGV